MELILKNIEKTIIEHNLIKQGEKIGVAVSGGKDSMCLLHILNRLTENLGFKIVAINIDHCLRENSANDSKFVKNYCEFNDIKLHAFKVDVEKVCADKKMTVEQGAREARYSIFKNLIKKGEIDKVALGHHMQDQAETILLNIFRGAGLSGAMGMDTNRDGRYIRPMLFMSGAEIEAYNAQNEVPFVEDDSNDQNDFNRNYIRNMIMPLIRNRWQGSDANICNFGLVCRKDDEYINNQINDNDYMILDNGMAKINISSLLGHVAIVNRTIMTVLDKIGVKTNIEAKHLKIIREMAIQSDNGSKISLPNNITVLKEYNFITITNKKFKVKEVNWKFKAGKFDIPNVGVVEVKRIKQLDFANYTCIVDGDKIDKANAVWRFRKDGDIICKFGGGTKSLNEFLIDKKVPARLRSVIPMLAIDNNILVVPGVEISQSVKVDENTKTMYGIKIVLFN